MRGLGMSALTWSPVRAPSTPNSSMNVAKLLTQVSLKLSSAATQYLRTWDAPVGLPACMPCRLAAVPAACDRWARCCSEALQAQSKTAGQCPGVLRLTLWPVLKSGCPKQVACSLCDEVSTRSRTRGSR